MTGLVIANWKMNASSAAVKVFADTWHGMPALTGVETVICPPGPYLPAVAAAMPAMGLGAQDVSAHGAGAFTGEVSAEMLRDLGCRWAIVGHSERRTYHGESNQEVAAKASAAASLGLNPVVCVGEALSDRDQGNHEQVVSEQLRASLDAVDPDKLVVAYEPIWAIGTGVTASADQANQMHGVIRAGLHDMYGRGSSQVRVIYGGSVKADNAGELFACDEIDGALVGGASLEAESFWKIAQAASAGSQ
jgi:triosephosphate isomerase